MKLAAAPNARGSAAPAPAPALVALARCGWRSCSVPRGSAKTSGLGRPRKGGSACRRVLAAGRPVCAARWERCRGHVPVQPWLWASGCGCLRERAEAKDTRVSACAHALPSHPPIALRALQVHGTGPSVGKGCRHSKTCRPPTRVRWGHALGCPCCTRDKATGAGDKSPV